MTGEHLGERHQAVDAHDVEQFLAAVGKVLAQMVADLEPIAVAYESGDILNRIEYLPL